MTSRTLPQNAAIHLYCQLMAEGINNTEMSVQEVVTLPISFTQDNFKELIWKKVQVSMFPDVKSTTQLDTNQVSEVYEEVNRLISNIAGFGVEFPSYDEQVNKSRVE